MKKIEAKIVADSISPQGHRITSMLLTYPRFIHGEVMTHRMFSRNSASSRAIPFEKMVKMVEEDPFVPIAWQKQHKGMQGTEYFTNQTFEIISVKEKNIKYTDEFKKEWLFVRDKAVSTAKNLSYIGLTKQLCNRLLEPFMWHTTLVTATEWENFFELRCPKYVHDKSYTVHRSKKDYIEYIDLSEYDRDELLFKEDAFWQAINTSQAEIHIQALAEAMWDAMNENTPKKLLPGEYHVPFFEIEED